MEIIHNAIKSQGIYNILLGVSPVQSNFIAIAKLNEYAKLARLTTLWIAMQNNSTHLI